MDRLHDLWTSMRPKQWVKNGFVFIPLIFGKKLFIGPDNWAVLTVFAAFCLMASAVYLLNDIVDAGSDRLHKDKRVRPIASGRLPWIAALVVSSSLAGTALALAAWVDLAAAAVLLAYLALNVLYTWTLKSFVIIDVFCIGFFFLLRVLAGAVAAQVALSHWLVFMIFLLAMFLGFNKRRQEILFSGPEPAARRSVLGKYSPYFIDQMISVLTSSIVVVYMLYTVDARTVNQFGSNHLFYSTPFVYYGIFRYLYIVLKRREGEDPTLILMKDAQMVVNLLLWASVCVAVIYFNL